MARCNAQGCSECWRLIEAIDGKFYLATVGRYRYRICNECFTKKMLPDRQNIPQVLIHEATGASCSCSKHLDGQALSSKQVSALSLLDFQDLFGTTWGVHTQIADT